MNKQTLLITGATGFIGSHLVRTYANKDDFRIIAIVRGKDKRESTERLQEQGAILFRGDFSDAELLSRIFRQYPIQCVIHMAAVRGAGAATEQDYRRVNVLGTETLLCASLEHNVQKFIFCSSVGVYGTIPTKLPADVATPVDPDNIYHDSKVQAEHKVKEFIRRGLNAYIVRPTITYGPGDNGFPQKLVTLVRKRMLVLPSQTNKIHLLSVNKFAELINLMIAGGDGSNRIFIAADEAPITLSELADMIYFHYFGSSYPAVLRIPPRAVEILSAAFRLLRNERWSTRISLLYQSWHYDLADTVRTFGYTPAKTKDIFVKSMCIEDSV